MTEQQRAFPEELQQAWDSAVQHPDPMTALAATCVLWRGLSRWQSALVADALSGGMTWEDIGRALGTSRQAAWARFRTVTDEPKRGDRAMQDDIAELRRQATEEVKVLYQRMRERDDVWHNARDQLHERQSSLREQLQSLGDEQRTQDRDRAEERKALQEEIRAKKIAIRDRLHDLRADLPSEPSFSDEDATEL